MLETIAGLEPLARKLEPGDGQLGLWMEEISKNTEAFIHSLETGKAYHKFQDMKGLLEVEPGLNTQRTLDEILEELEKDMLCNGLNPASGGHLGYIPGGGIFGGVMGDYLAALYNQYAGIFYGGPGAVKIENELIRWLCRLMAYPEGSLGNLTSGGSMANLIAIVTARESRNIKPEQISSLCIYLTEQVHHCVHKAIRISGLGYSQVRTIPITASFKMDIPCLQKQIQEDKKNGLMPFMVVGTVGTTDTGAIDPIEDLADLCEEHHIWFHVDAAYGGFFILSELNYPDGSTVKAAFRGIERSDSIAIDPHKGMFLSYGLGAVLIKDLASLYKAHYYKAAYMQDTLQSQDELSPADLSPELTKHFRGLRLWLPLRLYGIQPFQACLDEKILLCRYFYREIGKLGFKTGPFPETSVCIYRYIPDQGDANAFNQKIIEYVLEDGRVFLSSTTIQGIFWIRLAVLSFRTHIKTINICLDVLKSAVLKLK
ncbi:MAG: aminotransferase class I/II-fold pyridoxal phosphate-dependent enzyme [Saprospiraceae bacterium]|nr:aminotransferase class I/II-fold pyridoxal phosphate-dependent enzyme [Saprospiraceae bacterium]